jgi:hypothetical protein
MSGRALVAYSASSTHVQTTFDYLVYFQKYSGFSTSYVNVTHGAVVEFDFDGFDVIFHNYCARLCFSGYVSESYCERLRAFKGLKVLAVQDEYDRTDILKAAISDLGFDVVLTCVPQDALEYVYPRSEFPNVTFVTVFTGYVPDDFEAGRPPAPPLSDRPVLIGYRGRDIGGRYGQLGFDKFEIGRRMREICDARGIATDIAMDEASRIYGMAWFDYLGRCRAMLGSESGSNVFDFDGSIEARFRTMAAANGGVPPSYAEFLPFVAARDGEIEMGQISPRVFECAVMRTPMVLYRGRYSNAIHPDEHYIALEKDFSNIDEVLARLSDIPALEAMTERAYAHLVASGAFNYRTFFGMIGDVARGLLQGRHHSATETIAVSKEDSDSFELRDWTVHEQPSLAPDRAERFAARIAIPEIKILAAEESRLTREFERFRAARVRGLESQSQACRRAYVHLAAAGGEAIDLNRLLLSPQIVDFMAAADHEDAVWKQEWSNILARMTAAQPGGTTELTTVIIAASAGVRERYKTMTGRFARFEAICQSEQQRLQHFFADFRKAVFPTVRRMLAKGRLSPALLWITFQYTAKEALRVCIAPVWRAVRAIARAPRVKAAKIGIADRFPGLVSPGRRILGWLRSLGASW